MKTHNQKQIDINGTHLQGFINCSYATLVKTFGRPNGGDGYKQDAEWCIEFSPAVVATVYNYKTGRNYLGRAGIAKTKIKEWNVGGHTPDALLLVKAAIFDAIGVE